MTTSPDLSALVLNGQDMLPLPTEGESAYVTRFAPSPTGLLHLGHAYSARFAFETARRCGGRFLLRIEDIDRQRCREAFETAMLDDLAWLGIHWDAPPYRQSAAFETYALALDHLRELGVVYPCFCTRQSIRIEIEDFGRAPHGPSGELVYPGICRRLARQEAAMRMRNSEAFAWRLDVEQALAHCGPLWWYDCRAGWIEADALAMGDVVIARKDTPTSYHLAATLDDHLQDISMVTRGQDLFHATHIHRLLQALLGLRTPRYYHHNLVANSTGQRLAKRNRAITLRHLRDIGRSPDDVWRLLGLHFTGEALLG